MSMAPWKVILVIIGATFVAGSDQNIEQYNVNNVLTTEENKLNIDQMMTTKDEGTETELELEQGRFGTGLVTDQDNLNTQEMQGQEELTVGEVLSNNSRLLEEYEIQNKTGVMKTRKKQSNVCTPTSSCKRAGGHCFKSGNKCNGTIDSYGCLGGKNCLCCIPDTSAIVDHTCPDSVVACPTCPVVTSTSCQECPVNTCPTSIATTTVMETTTTSIETTAAPSTARPATTTVMETTTTSIETTAAPSTARPDISCPDTKVDAGQDLVCSRKTASYTWQQAVNYCTSLGLSLAHPENLLNLATKLLEETGSGWFWIAGRGTGNQQRWVNGTYVDSSLTEWVSGYPKTSTSECLVLYCTGSTVGNGKFLQTYACSKTTGHVLCE